MEDPSNKISIKNELLRKMIHLSSSIIPFAYFFIDRDLMLLILSVLTAGMIFTDLVRTRNDFAKKIYLKFLKPLLRSHEIENSKSLFSGGTYLVISFLLCIIIFPKEIAIMSMFVIVFCDSAAAIFGKVYGKHFVKNRSLEGSTAFFITGLIIIFLCPKATQDSNEYFIAITALLLTTIFELIPNKIDDNISIPLFFGTVYFVLIKIF